MPRSVIKRLVRTRARGYRTVNGGYSGSRKVKELASNGVGSMKQLANYFLPALVLFIALPLFARRNPNSDPVDLNTTPNILDFDILYLWLSVVAGSSSCSWRRPLLNISFRHHGVRSISESMNAY
jgi:hypothetical protein